MEARRVKVVHLRNTPEQPLTERQIVEATIAFANGATLEIDGLVPDSEGNSGEEKDAADLALARAFSELKAKGNKLMSDMPSTANLPQDVEQHRRRLRAATSARLSDLLHDRRAVARYYVGLGLDQFGGDNIALQPVLRETSKGLVFAHYYAFSSYRDLVMVGELLLADVERNHTEKLCQCQLADCGALFFEKRPPTGRPQRKYCSRAHMLKAHDQGASARMARRARAKAK